MTCPLGWCPSTREGVSQTQSLSVQQFLGVSPASRKHETCQRAKETSIEVLLHTVSLCAQTIPEALAKFWRLVGSSNLGLGYTVRKVRSICLPLAHFSVVWVGTITWFIIWLGNYLVYPLSLFSKRKWTQGKISSCLSATCGWIVLCARENLVPSALLILFPWDTETN